MKAIVSAPFWFEAAHHADDYPEGHPNRRIHGHSYRLIVSIEGEVNPRSGYVIDHDDLVVAHGAVLLHKRERDAVGLTRRPHHKRTGWQRTQVRFGTRSRVVSSIPRAALHFFQKNRSTISHL